MKTITKDLLLSGHNLNDYQRMFSLTEKNLSSRILTVASGFDSFNVEMHEQNQCVVSCSKIYDLPINKIENLVKTNLERLEKHIAKYPKQYKFTPEKTHEWLTNKRNEAAKQFLEDYEKGKEEGRYLHRGLPNLEFETGEFDIALCSHYLFSHSDLKDQTLYDYISEMTRVAKEVRIFPLSNVIGEISPQLGPVLLALQNHDYYVEVKEVPYEFIRGGNALLRVAR